MKTRTVIRTEAQRKSLQRHIGLMDISKPIEAVLRPYKRDRSLEQNALSHAWYAEIAHQRGDMTRKQVRRECKLEIGVPILRGDDADFCAIYDQSIKNLPHEMKLKAMDYLPVTRLMTVPQMQGYLDEMQYKYGKENIFLEAA